MKLTQEQKKNIHKDLNHYLTALSNFPYDPVKFMGEGALHIFKRCGTFILSGKEFEISFHKNKLVIDENCLRLECGGYGGGYGV